MRITANGDFEFCRWGKSGDIKYNIADTDPFEYFQQHMSQIRLDLLNGKTLHNCRLCHSMEQHGKISGREKQLLKVGVDANNFKKTMMSSPWLNKFKQSHNNQGYTEQLPVDWQIDLGNFCNSACIFCSPFSSSRLHNEFKKIGIDVNGTPGNWSSDPVLVDKLISGLVQVTNLQYLHFIGGEPMIMPSFEKILIKLIDAGLHTKVSIGVTTNLTVWNEKIANLLSQFKEVNLGLSIECLHPVNDYLRFGGTLSKTKEYLDKWVDYGNSNNWLLSLRSTPTVFSIFYLDTLYKYALEKDIYIESCNFIDDPDFMRPSVIPKQYRKPILDKLQKWAADNQHHARCASSANTRSPKFNKSALVNDLKSYINYLENMESEEHLIPQLLSYINKLELSRNNSIIEYAPEYTTFLQSHGYIARR